MKAVVSGLPHITSSLMHGHPATANRPSSSNTMLFARLRWSRDGKGSGGLYLSPTNENEKMNEKMNKEMADQFIRNEGDE